VDDLGQLIFVVLFILFGLISSSKRKKPSLPKPAARPRQAPRPEAAESGSGLARSRTPSPPARKSEVTAPRRQPPYTEQIVEPKRAIADELLLLLQGPPEPEPARLVTAPDMDDEARSLETLEPAGDESHERFRERYVRTSTEETPYAVETASADQAYELRRRSVERRDQQGEAVEPEPYYARARFKRKRNLTHQELRHAFVMKEVLGPPKAME
jgi:hypothetical protein